VANVDGSQVALAGGGDRSILESKVICEIQKGAREPNRAIAREPFALHVGTRTVVQNPKEQTMAVVKNLRTDLEPADQQMLAAITKARGSASTTACVRDLVRNFFDGMAKRLDPASRELFERGELDHRSYGLACLAYQDSKHVE
jgi:hypothetical protein